jgi:hypothetical protein
MKNFKSYITEIWGNKDMLYAIGPEKKIEYHDDSKNRMIEHPDAFKHLNFNDLPHSGEVLMGIDSLSSENARDYPGTDRPRAKAWGRINRSEKVLTISTEHGLNAYGTEPKDRDGKKRERDYYNRLDAVKELRRDYPDYQVHAGYEAHDTNKVNPRIMSYTQYEKHLADNFNQ